jgi:hypothetical protein
MIQQSFNSKIGVYTHTCQKCGGECEQTGVLDVTGAPYYWNAIAVCHTDKTFRHWNAYFVGQDGPSENDEKGSAKNVTRLAGYREHATGELFEDWRLNVESVDSLWNRKAVQS